MPVVVDASLAVKVVVPEQFSDRAKALVLYWEMQGVELVAPAFMALEFASAIRKKIHEGLLTSEDAKRLMLELYQSGIGFRPSRPLHSQAIDLAVELNQRLTYDSHYLALAVSLDCDFWTADEPFYRAARGRYPRVQWIGNYNP